MAELVEFSWDQITIGDNGFRFHIVCAGQNPIAPRLSCRYMDQEAMKSYKSGMRVASSCVQPFPQRGGRNWLIFCVRRSCRLS